MSKLNTAKVTSYVEENIGSFHEKRLESLNGIKLSRILQRKNPYLFKAKGIIIASDLVRMLLDAHLSSQEETIFGEFLEGLAIFICGEIYNGRKSAVEGIDLEFVRDETLYLVTIKSGPAWGNSSQLAKMKDYFTKAKKILRTNNSRSNSKYIFVNGCCYGSESITDKGDYFKYCGQEFWSFISGIDDLYTEIIEPIGYKAQIRNDAFNLVYAKLVNKLVEQFSKEYCLPSGIIDWNKIVLFNSGRKHS
ncbi:MAG: cytosolic protein [Pleurocapsa sp. SU_196_0]|nr:cytosolic protein [Pleurocapsa sp. SU_196_0]